ncbi:hypothetical protein [Peterkaempfera bronchialis]|uniref:Lipoprotein with Yx(FWY)xxD motif n=1 Tax=Peterkaempfera bronchialis TaxID=2126346 RepID=A0A345SUJ8_9ACTN|nr:hypothetical protein [Peterkaempfera bronchialis]AXI77403.1 hypothetical protein C7M71_008070 [Peterkaempfera bronchialis]
MTRERNTHAARRSASRALLATLLVCGLAGASACGKTVVIGDAPAPAAAAQSAPPPTAPAADSAPDSAPAGNDTLQLVSGSAAEHGRSGNGGTVVGAALQVQPPVWVQLSAVDAPDLGPHLINVNQSTLYRFDRDTADPSQSNCDADCATTWPPVIIKEGGNVYLAGIEPSRIGAIRRQDGAVQLTVGGWPIYRYSGDNRPGDTNGQGIGGTWFAVGPDGGKAAQR